MLCCAIGVAAVATGAIGWKQFRRFFRERLDARSLLTAAVVTLTTMAAAALAVEHFSHHVAHASGTDTALPTDPGALPLCRDGTPARITDITSTEE